MSLQLSQRSYLYIWNKNGEIIAKAPILRRSFSISSDVSADFVVTDLDGIHFFATPTSSGIKLNWEKKTWDLFLGQTLVFENYTISLLLERENNYPISIKTNDVSYDHIWEKIFDWMELPMQSPAHFKMELQNYLKILYEGSGAISSFIVLHHGSDFELLHNMGMSQFEAERIWQKMPPSLIEDTMKREAKIILPELLRTHAKKESTIFLKDVSSVCGFPVVVEGKVFAILFLGFENIISQLSPDLQKLFENAAKILGLVIQRALLREEFNSLKMSVSTQNKNTSSVSRAMIGNSKSLQNIYHLIERFSPFDIPILIQGETGTGKELAAREIHRFSPRSSKGFIAINAAALPENLIESELFGHKKGAFTGAISDKIGFIEHASGGTLFIDEIGELPLNLQAKLLRVLQDKKVQRVGETNLRDVDFRLVVATHRNLENLTKEGGFREDLYYRIAGAVISLPPLRERPEDISQLANYFRERFIQEHGLSYKEFSIDALLALEHHLWRGNIRELEHMVGRAVIMSDGGIIRKKDLFLDELEKNLSPSDEETYSHLNLSHAKEQWMKNFLIQSLSKYDGNRRETAKALGIGQRTLFRYLEQYHIR